MLEKLINFILSILEPKADATIKRQYFDDCTIGEFVYKDLKLATLERAWHNNERRVSCIPEGKYVCKRIISPKFGETYEICDVENRSHILFHAGNYTKDSLGCVLLGKNKLVERKMITQSKVACKEFMKALQDIDQFMLCIS